MIRGVASRIFGMPPRYSHGSIILTPDTAVYGSLSKKLKIYWRNICINQKLALPLQRKRQICRSTHNGVLAHLARARHWQCRGERFESAILHQTRHNNRCNSKSYGDFHFYLIQKYIQIAQDYEHKILKECRELQMGVSPFLRMRTISCRGL